MGTFFLKELPVGSAVCDAKDARTAGPTTLKKQCVFCCLRGVAERLCVQMGLAQTGFNFLEAEKNRQRRTEIETWVHCLCPLAIACKRAVSWFDGGGST